MRICSIATISLVIALAAAGNVHAAVMYGAVGVSSSLGNFNPTLSLQNLINQSGLSAGYVSGVTDAATYSALHTDGYGEWQSSTPLVLPDEVTFDLGVARTISGFRYWGSTWWTGGMVDVKTFSLLFDDDIDPTNGVTGTSALFTTAVPGSPFMQSFSFDPITTRYVHMRIASTHESTFAVGFAEAAFVGEVAPPAPTVPEPATLAIWSGIGLVGLVGASRRRRASA